MTPELLDRLPPQNLDAEKSVLGSLMLDSRFCDDVAPILKPGDFYAAQNGTLYGHLLALHDQGRRVDMILVVNRLNQAGDLEAVGGPAYLQEVLQSVAYAHNAGYHAALVREKATRRAMLRAAEVLIQSAHDATSEVVEALDAAEAALSKIETGETEGEPIPFRQALFEVQDRAVAAEERHEHCGLLTGLSGFDSQMGGLFAGELAVLAARPGIGKTSLACQVALWVATHGRAVYYASLEMRPVELALRIACGEADVSSKAVRTGVVVLEAAHALAETCNRLSALNLWIHYRPRMSIQDVRRAARRLTRHGLALVVVDYLQLLTPPDRRVQRHEQIGQLTADLKALAGELCLPVLCLCQLSREAEKTQRPTMAHLRESGSIEQDADVIGLLWRDGEKTEFRIDKNRNGETGMFALTWQANRTRFVEHTFSEFDSFR